MYAVVRTYSGSGAKELFDLLEGRTVLAKDSGPPAPGYILTQHH